MVLVIVASGRTFARDSSNPSIEEMTETVCVPAPTRTPPAIYARVKTAGRDMVRMDAFRPLLGAEFHGRKKPDISAEIHKAESLVSPNVHPRRYRRREHDWPKVDQAWTIDPTEAKEPTALLGVSRETPRRLSEGQRGNSRERERDYPCSAEHEQDWQP